MIKRITFLLLALSTLAFSSTRVLEVHVINSSSLTDGIIGLNELNTEGLAVGSIARVLGAESIGDGVVSFHRWNGTEWKETSQLKRLNILYIAQSNGRGRYGGGGDLATNPLVKVQNYSNHEIELWTPETRAGVQIRGGNGNNNLLFHFAKSLAEKFSIETISACTLEESQGIEQWLVGGTQRQGLEDLITNHPPSIVNPAVKFDLVFYCQGEHNAGDIFNGIETVEQYAASFNQLHTDLITAGAITADTQWIICEQADTSPQNHLNDTFWNTLRWPFTVIPSRGLSTPANDPVHYDGPAQVQMGRQLAMDAYFGNRHIAIPETTAIPADSVQGFTHDTPNTRHEIHGGLNVTSRVTANSGTVVIKSSTMSHDDFAIVASGGDVYADVDSIVTSETVAHQTDGIIISDGSFAEIKTRVFTAFNNGANDLHQINVSDDCLLHLQVDSITQLGQPDIFDFDDGGGTVKIFARTTGREVEIRGNRRFAETSSTGVTVLNFHCDAKWVGDPALSNAMFQTGAGAVELIIEEGFTLRSNQQVNASVTVSGGGTFVFDATLN